MVIVKRIPEQRLHTFSMEWIPMELMEKGCQKITWMEGVQEAMIVRALEADQWKDREEWRLVYGRQRKMSRYRKYNKNNNNNNNDKDNNNNSNNNNNNIKYNKKLHTRYKL